MQLKSNNISMLGLTKSINMPASTSSTVAAQPPSIVPILTRIERTSSGRFVVKKANSIDDECSSEAISSCSDNDDKLFAITKCHDGSASSTSNHTSAMLYEDVDGDDENSDDSDADLMLDHFDVTLVDDDMYSSPKNDAERMFLEVVEVLRFEQEVWFLKNYSYFWVLGII